MNIGNIFALIFGYMVSFPTPALYCYAAYFDKYRPTLFCASGAGVMAVMLLWRYIGSSFGHLGCGDSCVKSIPTYSEEYVSFMLIPLLGFAVLKIIVHASQRLSR